MAFHGSADSAGSPARPLEAADSGPGGRMRKLGSLRTLWPFLARHRALFTAWLLALAVSSTATLSLPVAVRHMIDNGFGGGNQINQAFGLLFVVAVVLAMATAARFFFVSLLGEKVVADLRGQLYGHLIGLDTGFHDRSRSGELVSRLSADSELLRSVIGTTMSVALRSTVTVVGSLVMLFVTSPQLAVYSLVGIPLAVLPIVLGARRLEKASRASQDRVADANALAAETLGAVRTVQAYAREPYERGRFGQALAVEVATARRRIGAQALVTAAAIVLVFGAIVLVLWSGAHRVIEGTMSAGTLGQFVLYALIGGGSVGALAEVWNELQRAAGGMGRISELLQEQPAIARAAEADGFIEALPQGYASELGERGARLSGGQQQRVAIARALLKDAPVLLLDEATSALDAQSERAVQHALENLMRGRTTLVVAHRLATVLRADRIVVMDRGTIVAEGSHAELIAQGGLYAELAKLQFLD